MTIFPPGLTKTIVGDLANYATALEQKAARSHGHEKAMLLAKAERVHEDIEAFLRGTPLPGAKAPPPRMLEG